MSLCFCPLSNLFQYAKSSINLRRFFGANPPSAPRCGYFLCRDHDEGGIDGRRILSSLAEFLQHRRRGVTWNLDLSCSISVKPFLVATTRGRFLKRTTGSTCQCKEAE